MRARFQALPILCVLTAGLAGPAAAGVVVHEKGETKIEVGALVQTQYSREDPEDGEATDDLSFRRLRPHIAGTVGKNWWAKVQLDFARAIDGAEVAVKDAYVQYKGWQADQHLVLTLGNAKTPFSRNFLTSSAKQQTVERGFAGNHNYGTPDRQLGLRLDGHSGSERLTWALAAGAEHHDPDVRRMDFDTPTSNQSDWNQGWVVAGRVDFHPLGFVAFDHGDFHSDAVKYNLSLAYFTWSNDGDVDTYTHPASGTSVSQSRADLDHADGWEISAGLRGNGFSLDAELQQVHGDTMDPAFTGGIYADGGTDLDKLLVQGGYMLPGDRFELVAKWDSLDADNYADPWQSWELGLNHFWDQHKLKAQVTFRRSENVDGIAGADADTLFAQFQYVF